MASTAARSACRSSPLPRQRAAAIAAASVTRAISMVSIRLSTRASRLEPFDPDHAWFCGDMTVLIDMSERCAHGGFERIVGNEGKGSSRAFLSGRALDDALDRHLLVCKSSGDGCNRARPI